MQWFVQPAWNFSTIAIVYPSWEPDLFDAFEYLIRLFAEHHSIWVIVDSAETENILRIRFPQTQVMIVKDLDDIWIRDWSPIGVIGPDGSQRFVKALYRPRHVALEDASRADQDGRQIAEKLGHKLLECPLVWDYSNFAFNGAGIGIVTTRIISDNPDVTDVEIRNILRDKLGITTLLILPEASGDDTGHVCAMVRFLNRTTIGVASYPDPDSDQAMFMDETAQRLDSALGELLRIVRVPQSDDPLWFEIEAPNTLGNHLNFLLMRDVLYLPMYGTREDNEALEVLQNAVSKCRIVEVRHPDLDYLSFIGVTLNRVTAQF